MVDEITCFKGIVPSNDKLHTTVIEATNFFDDVVPRSRRLWSDGAAEIKAAARVITKMLATTALSAKHWAELEKDVEYKDKAAPIKRYLGALYSYQPFDPKHADSPRKLDISMADYIRNAFKKFSEEHAGRLRNVTSPFLTDKEWAVHSEVAGRYAASCSSHVATLLFLMRVARPDIAVPVQRMCSQVSRWDEVCDDALVRAMTYLDSTVDYSLVGVLAPGDEEGLTVDVFPDTDWNGDACTTRSTNGCFVELRCDSSDHSWPVSWYAKKQTATSSSSAEAETIGLSVALRTEALPIQQLVEDPLGHSVTVRLRVDNTQAIAAAKRWYSKKLRYRARTHRVSIGLLHECTEDPTMNILLEYLQSARQKEDIFTKALLPAPFAEARERIGVVLRRPAKQ